MHKQYSFAMKLEPLTHLNAGDRILVGGNQFVTIDAALAADFETGDSVLVADGELVHITRSDSELAADAVDQAAKAFEQLGSITDDAITEFFVEFARLLESAEAFGPVGAANAKDVATAQQRGRSTTRLVLSDTMRADMVEGLRAWAQAPSGRGDVVEHHAHSGWEVSLVRAGLGVVGFVFEGRPNVFADACGVLRSGNTVVFRIGSDALGTAQAIVEHCLQPALAHAGLPAGSAVLINSASRGSGAAMFNNVRLSLAVARGSGPAVAQLGSIARSAGVAVSLHGTGGAWMVASETADLETLHGAIVASLDRKVCNTVNTVCIPVSVAESVVPAVLAAAQDAAQRLGTNPKFHLTESTEPYVGDGWRTVTEIARADGNVAEPQCEPISVDMLGHEWEWEQSPEITVCVVDNVSHAVSLFNEHAPRFVASLIASGSEEHEAFFNSIDAPFVGNGFTRWVDGQYAFNRPELGLSNWQFGRLFSRGGVLSGDSVFTLRTRVNQTDPTLSR